MEVELSKNSIARLADALAPRVALILQRKMKEHPEDTELLSTREAAQLLKISEDRLRKIKDRFAYVKQGDASQGKLLFLKSGLIENYCQT